MKYRSIEGINNQYRIDDRLVFLKGKNGLLKANLFAHDCATEVYLQGATVTGACLGKEKTLLFLSQNALFEPGKPIRGGVPIVFPWFSGQKQGPGPAHGFARIHEWEIKETKLEANGDVTIKLLLPEDIETFSQIDRSCFSLEYSVTLGQKLSLGLTTTNLSQDTIEFADCLHTYFYVSHCPDIKIRGLEGKSYIDYLDEQKEKKQTNSPITIAEEIDRIYFNSQETCYIEDPGLERTLEIAKTGSNSTVVWNPWIEKSKKLQDFDDQEYLKMVCVESGNLERNKISLGPGKSHTLRVDISS